MNEKELLARIAAFPRVTLIHRPTPMRKLEALSKELGGPEIWIKRDDLTGMALGGNKARKLEFIMPDVLAKKCDVLVTWGALQSNWAMQAAAASRRFGIKPVLVLFKRYDLPLEPDGNMLLDALLEADVRIKEPADRKSVHSEETLAAVEEAAAEYRAGGHNVYVVSVGGSMPMGSMDRPLGALGYVDAFAEMLGQTKALGFVPNSVVHSSGSGATQAGLLVGARSLAVRTRIVGISVSDEKGPFGHEIRAIAEATENLLNLPFSMESDDLIVFDEYIREGYGIVSREVAEIIRWVFEREGIVLDPVYTSKAFIGLVDLVRKGYIRKTEKVVFFHTGGVPALFPNRRSLADFLAEPPPTAT